AVGRRGAVPERARAGPGRSAGGRHHSGVAGGRAAAAAEPGHAREAQANGGKTVQEDGDIDAELRREASEEIVSGTRREWLQTMAALSAGAVADALIPRWVLSQQPDRLAAFRAQIGAVPIQAQSLGENLTMLSGRGGNVVVLRDPGGLIVVDTFVAPAWPKREDSLKSLGSRVKFVINTHWHFDHTDNNGPLRAIGATVVAHENTRRRMSAPQHIAMLDLDFPPSPPAALPQRVFDDRFGMEANGMRLELTHVAPAHTDTDVIVRFEQANVLHA